MHDDLLPTTRTQFTFVVAPRLFICVHAVYGVNNPGFGEFEFKEVLWVSAIVRFEVDVCFSFLS